ncbi:MAG: ArsR family transcriptional regulator, partial [Nitrosopumilus sp.]
MQLQIQKTRKIEDDQKKEAILGIVSDRYCRQILYSTIDRPKSVMEISYENKIPISTVYRRIQTLHDNKLVGVSGLIS